MFGLNLSIVWLITSALAMCACNRLPDAPQTAPSGISHPDADIMAKMMNMEEHYDEKLRNIEARYDGLAKEMKKHYDGEIQEIKKHYDGEILELKSTQTTKLSSHETTIMELKDRHDEMKSSHDEMKSRLDEMMSSHDEMKSRFDEMKSSHDEMKSSLDEMISSHDEMKASLDEMKSTHDAEILALKESYYVIKTKYNRIIKGKEIDASIIKVDDTLYPNNLHKDRVDKNRKKPDPQTEITSPQQKSDPSLDLAKGRNNYESPAQTANTESEQLKQLPEMSGHNVLEHSDNGINTVEGKSVGFSAFQAYMSADYTGNDGDTLVYDDVRINIGGVYNALLGTFTAPTAGLYVINTSHMADSTCGTEHTCTSLRVNGVHISHSCSEYPISTAKTELVQLVAGDEVWVQTLRCDSFNGETYTSFSGYLLLENI